MLRLIQTRLLQLVIVLVGIGTVLFFLLQISGDPTLLLLPDGATDEDRRVLREQLGLEDPIPVQYARFFGQLVTLNFGESFTSRQPAIDQVLAKLPNTLVLAITAQVAAVIIGIPIGIYAATNRGSPFSFLFMLMALIGQAIPAFWMGILFIMFFSVRLGWLPTSGMDGPQYIILPAATLAFSLMPSLVRLSRSGMLDVLNQDYIRTARSKGLAAGSVIYGHALKNMMIPVVTVIALEFAQVMGGVVVVETIFGWDGIGRQLIRAVQTNDYPVVQATVFVVAVITVLINLLLDIVYGWLDPRIRL